MAHGNSDACRAVFDPNSGWYCLTHKQRLVACDCCGMWMHIPNRQRGPVRRFCSGTCRVRYHRRLKALRACQRPETMLVWMEEDER